MAIRTHKRKKNTRLRGSRTGFTGFRQKNKGHGNKGGVGMSGSGKRADHKKQVAIEMDKNKKYFGRAGLTSRRVQKKKTLQINLRDIKDNFLKKGKSELDFSKYKILGVGEGFKAVIKAKEASKTAIEKMKKAGGEIVFVKKEKKVSKKEVE